MAQVQKKRKLSVNNVLKNLGVSKSGYYASLNRPESKQSIRKKIVKTEIIKAYNESHQIYGAPKITKALSNKGIKVAQKTVGNYMKEEGIRAIWVSRYVRTTIDPCFDQQLKNILNREFCPTRPNAVWVTDITYCYTLSGFVYLTSVMDLYSRKIIGWHVSDSLSTEGVLCAIRRAKKARKTENPTIIHSDRGVQYISKDYIKETPADQFIRSYSRKGTPWDNACIEAFHALIKREWLNRFVVKNLKHAHELIFQYIETFYNTSRLHSHCEMSSPYEYELNSAS